MSSLAVKDPACVGVRWASALFDGLVGGGVRQVVLSPGSRSTPLVLAAQRKPELVLTAVLDERSAAFFALGLAQASRRPVALLCTSGSAPGHWLPAVIEAHASGVPLVLLSADRPPELRPWGANQTIDQTRLFGVFVLEFHDPGRPDDNPEAIKGMRALGRRAAGVSQGRRPGPVHINLPFLEPLVPEADCEVEIQTAGTNSPAPVTRASPHFSGHEGLSTAMRGRGIIVCGPGDWHGELAEPLWRCSEKLCLPILADPLSGLRFGPAGAGLITRYDSLLRNPAASALRPDWVLRFGGPPVSKTLLEWLRGISVLLIDPGGQWRDPTHDALLQVEAEPAQFCDWLAESGLTAPDPAWLSRWTAAERRLNILADAYLARAPWFEPHLIQSLLEHLPDGGAMFIGNSLPVRQLDSWSGARSRHIRIFGNRGASGIDGNLSTLAGLNSAGIPTLGLLGDLALFHDLSGLLLAQHLRLPLVVINNGGGRIFDYLPQHGLPGFETLWRTPVALDMRRLAELFGIAYGLATDTEGLREAIDEQMGVSHAGLIEVRVDAELSRELHRDFWQLVGRESIIPI